MSSGVRCTPLPERVPAEPENDSCKGMSRRCHEVERSASGLSCSVAARSAGGIVAVAPTAGSSDDVVADGLYDCGALVVDPSEAGWLDWSTCGWPYWLG